MIKRIRVATQLTTRKSREAVETVFQPIERTHHLPEKVADEIGKKIEAGEIGPGRKLPGELMLAKTFGVSRSVIREAIAKLRSEGMVETRHGIGAFVISTDRRPSARLEISCPPKSADLLELFQLRLPLEKQAARLAASLRTSENLRTIEHTVIEMKAVNEWLSEGIGTDIAFHLAIANSTQNSFYRDVLAGLLAYMGNIIPLSFSCSSDSNIAALTFDEHHEVFQYIATQDPDGAENAMSRHVINSAKRLGISETLLFGADLNGKKRKI